MNINYYNDGYQLFLPFISILLLITTGKKGLNYAWRDKVHKFVGLLSYMVGGLAICSVVNGPWGKGNLGGLQGQRGFRPPPPPPPFLFGTRPFSCVSSFLFFLFYSPPTPLSSSPPPSPLPSPTLLLLLPSEN
jgi:hypothetical protein